MITKINGIPITTQFHAIDGTHSYPHQGIDLAIPMNTPVPSVSNGVVTHVLNEGGKSFGKSVYVHTGNGNDIIYGHLNNFNVKVGEHIHAGDIIGLSGNTGHSTGAHLHIQVMHNNTPVNPYPFVKNINFSSHQYSVVPWWDFKDRTKEWILTEMHSIFMNLLHGLVDSLYVILPTLATIGILWWMIPFMPKSDHAPKLTGLSMLAYMFLVLIKGAM